MTKLLERHEAHYEVEDVEMGKVYRWCPERAVVECTCGERLTFSAFQTTCPGCATDHAGIVEEVLDARPEDKGGAIIPGATCSPTRPQGVPR